MPKDWESRIALAMLPVGAVMTLVSVLGIVAAALFALDIVARWPAGAGWLLAWCGGAVLVGSRNTTRSIETMSSFEWRPMAEVLALSALIALGYPGWWSGA